MVDGLSAHPSLPAVEFCFRGGHFKLNPLTFVLPCVLSCGLAAKSMDSMPSSRAAAVTKFSSNGLHGASSKGLTSVLELEESCSFAYKPSAHEVGEDAVIQSVYMSLVLLISYGKGLVGLARASS